MGLSPKNWSAFQHYKDRSPAWIKLHRGLLDNLDYHQLSPGAAKALPLVWLVASEFDGVLPDPARLAFRLRIPEADMRAILDELVSRSFLVDSGDAEHAEQGATQAQKTAKANGFGSRHISDKVRRAVWERDGGACCKCGATEDIEYDHVVPVSKGGMSDIGNIQLLCRPCNRSKRVRIATHAQPNTDDSRSLEEEEQEKKEVEKIIGRSPKKAMRPANDDFEEFCKVYPKRKGADPKAPARAEYEAAVKAGADPKRMLAALKAGVGYDKDKIGTEFIPRMTTWLGEKRYEDYLNGTEADNGRRAEQIEFMKTKGYILEPDPASPSGERWVKREKPPVSHEAVA